jgi:hypothetical protein
MSRQQRSTFVVMLRPLPGVDGIKALRFVLKRLLRQHGLRCVALHETHDDADDPIFRTPKVPPPACDLQSGNRNEPQTVTKKESHMVTKSEAFPSKWISAADLPKPIVREIVETNSEVLKTRDGVSSRKLIVHFRDMRKALVVNATNFDAIVDITGEFDSDNWPGHSIELFPSTTPMGGKIVDCVRVRAPGPSPQKAATAKTAEPETEAGFGDEFNENPGPDDDREIPF